MTVLVTGGSGVVGRPIVRRLVAAGREVRALVRSAGAAEVVRTLGAQPIPGDLLDYASLHTAIRGSEIVYHVAGVNEPCPVDPTTMLRANVEGTRRVLRAAHAAGARRLVYTSSAVTLGEAHGTVGSEDSPHRGSFLSAYERSKWLAEQVALHDSGDVEVVVVNPSSVQGPGRASGTGRIILDLVAGRLPVMVDTWLSLVDIDDCAEGHLLAEEHGLPGRRYVLNGFTLRAREAVSLLERAAGRPLRIRFVPGGLAALGAPIVGASFRALRRPPPLCREMVRVLRHGHRYDGTRASRELGLEYRAPEETIRRTIDWFESEGLLE